MSNHDTDLTTRFAAGQFVCVTTDRACTRLVRVARVARTRMTLADGAKFGASLSRTTDGWRFDRLRTDPEAVVKALRDSALISTRRHALARIDALAAKHDFAGVRAVADATIARLAVIETMTLADFEAEAVEREKAATR